MSDSDGELALVLGGGGARGAYQVGCLRALAKRFPDLEVPIRTGVSAGAINTVYLGSHPGSFQSSVADLEDVWQALTVERVFRTDFSGIVSNALRWALRLSMGGARVAPRTRGLVDTTPLRRTLEEALRGHGAGIEGIARNIAADRVRAVAFMEAMIRPLSFSDLPGPLKIMMRVMRNPFFNWLLVGVMNMFLRVMLQDLTHTKLSPEVLAHYRGDHPTVKSRRAVARFPREVPFDGNPSKNYGYVTGYIDWLAATDVPKLLLHADDGVAIKADEVAWCRATLSNLEVVDLGHGKHFLQETHPVKIGRALSRWYRDAVES